MDDRGPLVFDGRTKAAWNTRLTPDGPHRWRVSQRLYGAADFEEEEAGGWSLEGVVDLTDDTDPAGLLVAIEAITPG